jgi:hypothetical protein
MSRPLIETELVPNEVGLWGFVRTTDHARALLRCRLRGDNWELRENKLDAVLEVCRRDFGCEYWSYALFVVRLRTTGWLRYTTLTNEQGELILYKQQYLDAPRDPRIWAWTGELPLNVVDEEQNVLLSVDFYMLHNPSINSPPRLQCDAIVVQVQDREGWWHVHLMGAGMSKGEIVRELSDMGTWWGMLKEDDADLCFMDASGQWAPQDSSVPGSNTVVTNRPLHFQA